jgi:hypothetical protein
VSWDQLLPSLACWSLCTGLQGHKAALGAHPDVASLNHMGFGWMHLKVYSDMVLALSNFLL